MKITAMTAAAIAGTAWAGTAWAGEVERKVTVCMETGINAPVVNAARALASKMFGEIGVTLDWRRVGQTCPAGAVVVSLSPETRDDLLPGAWAYARPFEGIHIVVFYDRLEKRVPPARVSCLLAHVLVHEIAHMLQASNSHSATGIMKEHYNPGDHFEMRRKPLRFTPEDVDLIHRGLDARESRMATSIAAQ